MYDYFVLFTGIAFFILGLCLMFSRSSQIRQLEKLNKIIDERMKLMAEEQEQLEEKRLALTKQRMKKYK